MAGETVRRGFGDFQGRENLEYGSQKRQVLAPGPREAKVVLTAVSSSFCLALLLDARRSVAL